MSDSQLRSRTPRAASSDLIMNSDDIILYDVGSLGAKTHLVYFFKKKRRAFTCVKYKCIHEEFIILFHTNFKSQITYF